jgi:hypothetical protein
MLTGCVSAVPPTETEGKTKEACAAALQFEGRRTKHPVINNKYIRFAQDPHNNLSKWLILRESRNAP